MATATTAKQRPARGPSRPSHPHRGWLPVALVACLIVGGSLAWWLWPTAPAPAIAPGLPPPASVPVTTVRLTPTHENGATAWALPTYGGPRDVLVGATGTVWLTQADAATVSTFDGSSLRTYELAKTFDAPSTFRLAAGDGAVWFTGYPDGSVGRILPDGTANLFAPFATGETTASITRASDGSMWATDPARGMVVQIGLDGSVRQLPVPAVNGRDAHPYDIVTGADGVLWFTDPTTGTVGRLDPSSGRIDRIDVGSAPRSIVLAPDGTLWVTRSKARTLAHIDPATEAVTAVPVPTADGSLNDLAVAPDGSLWVTQEAPQALHLSPGGDVLASVALPGGARFADGIAVGADGTAWTVTVSGNSLVEVPSS